MYLERRRRRWYLAHDLPADVADVMGKKRLVKSLECEDKPTAERRAAAVMTQWRTEIARARRVSQDQLEKDAAFWRSLYMSASPHERPAVRSMIVEEAQERAHGAAIAHGVLNYGPEFDAITGQESRKFIGVATGEIARLDTHIDEFVGTLRNEPKTVAMKRSTVEGFCKEFPHSTDVSRKAVQRWVNRMLEGSDKEPPKVPKTVRRVLSEVRSFWAYLQNIEVVLDDTNPFDKLTLPNNGKAEGQQKRKAFTPEAVVTLHRAAVANEDDSLADLITMGMWTGCRIEELCGLPISKVDLAQACFSVEDAKTPAGWRQVPIHSKLAPTMDRLVKASKDGFVLSGLSVNKYGDRSNAVGKRFGRLKAAAGYGEDYVFHSIRKTVSTMLENAGVAENVAADILGHEKPTMTYGLYSGGNSLALKREAIEKLHYPGK